MPVLLRHDVTGPADAPVLVLSGSVGSTIEMWQPNLPALAGTFRVVRLDHRGHGGSLAPPGPYRIGDLAEDALATLDALGVGRFAWCGLSMGAMVGMAVATTHPERLSSLVLCCTSAGFADPAVWRDRAHRVAQVGTAGLATEIVARWFTPDWAARHPGKLQLARGWVRGTDDDAYRHCCEAIAAWDHVGRLPAITTPTLVIAGRYDLATPVVPDAMTLVSGIRGARLEVLAAAHLATMQCPEEASCLITEHVARTA